MNNREFILKSIQSIEEDIKFKLSTHILAKELGFSKYYYSTLFKSITGYSPKAYIRARKITESVQDILYSDKRIIDIALDYGFASSEVYSRAFQRIINKKPSQVRKEGSINKNLLVKPITDMRLKKYEHALDKKPEIVHLQEIKLIGIPFYYDSSMKDSLEEQWSLLMNNVNHIQHKKIPDEFYQIQYTFENQENDSLYFYVATAVEQYEETPIQFTAKTIPAGKYFKFRHVGLANEVGHTYRYIYEEWLPSTDYRLSSHFYFEYYGDEYLGPFNKDSVSEIYIPMG